MIVKDTEDHRQGPNFLSLEIDALEQVDSEDGSIELLSAQQATSELSLGVGVTPSVGAIVDTPLHA